MRIAPIFIVIVALLFFFISCTLVLYRKAGLAGWELFVPIYNYYCMFRIGNLNPPFMLLLLVPVINLFLIMYLQYRVFRCFGVTKSLSILFVLFCYVGLPVVALSNKYQYEGSY